VAVPGAIALTNPVLDTVAIAVFEDDQLPPWVALLRSAVVLSQIVVVPVMA